MHQERPYRPSRRTRISTRTNTSETPRSSYITPGKRSRHTFAYTIAGIARALALAAFIVLCVAVCAWTTYMIFLALQSQPVAQ